MRQRRYMLIACTATTTGALSVGLALPAMADYPVNYYGPVYCGNYGDGESYGHFTWYNRSVGYTGYVSAGTTSGPNTPAPSSVTIHFDFFTGRDADGMFVGEQSRTATKGTTKGFSNTEDGSYLRGGINSVDVFLECEPGGQWVHNGYESRPSP